MSLCLCDIFTRGLSNVSRTHIHNSVNSGNDFSHTSKTEGLPQYLVTSYLGIICDDNKERGQNAQTCRTRLWRLGRQLIRSQSKGLHD